MKRFVLGLFAGLAVTVATSLSSFAGYTGAGGLLAGSTSGLSPNTGILGQAFIVQDVAGDAAFITGANSGNSGDFASGFNFKNFFSGTYNFGAASTVGAAGNFGSSSTYGTFIGTVTKDTGVSGDNNATSRQIIFSGTFTPGADGVYGAITTPVAALFQVTISKTGAGGGWTGAWTMDTTANASVPEPTSIAIFGLGAVGFAVRRFRRK